MVYKEYRHLNVGKRAKDDSNKITLLGVTLEPNVSKGQILFLPGFSGNFEDYSAHFLEALAETFRVDAYNYRGHPGSKGKFNTARTLDDTELILDKIDNPVLILAQSYGANLAARLEPDKVKSTYCLTPLFDLQMLPILQRVGVNILNVTGYLPGILPTIDYIFDSTGIAKKAGFPNTHPLQSFAQLAKLKKTPHNKPTAFALADNDEILSTRNNVARYIHLVDQIKTVYPHAKNRSELVRGLNHCLNLTKGDFVPFLKPEKGKDSDKIIEDIVNFFSD
ncbi:alpha/beta hydrolase [Candidatus Woesearchaeota archaeon]|nr:alpha/beta hydrolase [Candidatus Woesearchaeota archaeon]MBW2994652.1 alpha/beta hydrolase [Candidatus Woesearchaeota archaeon]